MKLQFPLSLPISLFFLFVLGKSYAQSFNWAEQFGDIFWDEGRSIATDSQGNVYFAGHFEGTVDFDPGAGVFNLTSVDDKDLFVCKLNPEGDLLWAKNTGDSSYIECNAIDVDSQGNVYVAGSFLGQADFDPGPGVYVQTSSYWDRDIFVQKLDTDGNFIWAKQISGISTTMMSNPSPCNAHAMVIDNQDNLYLTGYFDGQVDFNPSPSDTFLLNVVQQSDIFICKLDANGQFVWSKQIGGTKGGVGYAIAVDENQGIYTTGTIGPSAIFDFDPGPGSYNLSAPDLFESEIYISKLDSAGNFAWAKLMGRGQGSSIVVDETGFSYSTAWFPFSQTPVINKLSPLGDSVWTIPFGGLYSNSLALDSYGNLLIFGVCYSGTHDFDPGPGIFNLNAGADDGFLSKWDSAGNFIWAGLLDAQNQFFTNAVTVDPNNQIYLTGYFDQVVDFDPAATTYNLSSQGSYDIFLCSFNESLSAIDAPFSEFNLRLYPNPTDGDVTIEFSEELQKAEVTCYSLTGEEVPVQYKLKGNSMNLHLDLDHGLYLLKISYPNGNHSIIKVQKL